MDREEVDDAVDDYDGDGTVTVAVRVDAVEDGTIDAVDAAELADEAVDVDTVVVDAVVADATEVEAGAVDVDGSKAETVTGAVKA